MKAFLQKKLERQTYKLVAEPVNSVNKTKGKLIYAYASPLISKKYDVLCRFLSYIDSKIEDDSFSISMEKTFGFLDCDKEDVEQMFLYLISKGILIPAVHHYNIRESRRYSFMDDLYYILKSPKELLQQFINEQEENSTCFSRNFLHIKNENIDLQIGDFMEKVVIAAVDQSDFVPRIVYIEIMAKEEMSRKDVLDAIEKSCLEYCNSKTKPQSVLSYQDFGYTEFEKYVPNSICEKYGISKIDKSNYVIEIENEVLVCDKQEELEEDEEYLL